MSVQDTPSTVVDQAYEAAKQAYDKADGGYPAGFAWVIGADARRKAMRQLQDDPRFDVRTDGATTVHLDFVSEQSLQKKAAAYDEFLAEMQAAGRLTDARVYKRWD